MRASLEDLKSATNKIKSEGDKIIHNPFITATQRINPRDLVNASPIITVAGTLGVGFILGRKLAKPSRKLADSSKVRNVAPLTAEEDSLGDVVVGELRNTMNQLVRDLFAAGRQQLREMVIALESSSSKDSHDSVR